MYFSLFCASHRKNSQNLCLSADGGSRRMASSKVVCLLPSFSISTQMTSPSTQILGASSRKLKPHLPVLWTALSYTMLTTTFELTLKRPKSELFTDGTKNLTATGMENDDNTLPIYLGVILDRSLIYKVSIAKTKFKVESREKILKKLAKTKCRAKAVQSAPQPFATPQQNKHYQCGADHHTQSKSTLL